MANAASKEQVESDLKPADFAGSLEIMRNRIKAKKDHVSSTNGEISGLWDQIEKKGVSKRGGRIFMQLDGLEESERKDALRTIENLAALAGWNNSGDLVDSAEGKNNVVEMPKAGGKGKGAEADPDLEAKINVADFKAAVADHIEANSETEKDDAYALANEIYDDLPSASKSNLTVALARKLADAEMAGWPEADAEG